MPVFSIEIDAARIAVWRPAGMRAAEQLQLNWRDVSFERRMISGAEVCHFFSFACPDRSSSDVRRTLLNDQRLNPIRILSHVPA
jgi:hypothetical protein